MKEMEYKLKEQDNNYKINMKEKEYKHIENMKAIEIDKIKLENEHTLNMFKEKSYHDMELIKLEYEKNMKNKEFELLKEILDKIPTEILVELLKPRLSQISQQLFMNPQICQYNSNYQYNNYINQNITLKNKPINNNIKIRKEEEDNSELNTTFYK